jgi:hypothetical protein
LFCLSPLFLPRVGANDVEALLSGVVVIKKFESGRDSQEILDIGRHFSKRPAVPDVFKNEQSMVYFRKLGSWAGVGTASLNGAAGNRRTIIPE